MQLETVAPHASYSSRYCGRGAGRTHAAGRASARQHRPWQPHSPFGSRSLGRSHYRHRHRHRRPPSSFQTRRRTSISGRLAVGAVLGHPIHSGQPRASSALAQHLGIWRSWVSGGRSGRGVDLAPGFVICLFTTGRCGRQCHGVSRGLPRRWQAARRRTDVRCGRRGHRCGRRLPHVRPTLGKHRW